MDFIFQEFESYIVSNYCFNWHLGYVFILKIIVHCLFFCFKNILKLLEACL